MVLLALTCAAVLISTAALAVVITDATIARLVVYGVCLIASLALFSIALLALLGVSYAPSAASLPLGLPWLGAHFRRAFGLFPCRRQSRRGCGQPVRARIRPPRGCPAPGAAVLSGVSRRHEHRGARR
jgi:hypothetical protein